MLFNYFSVRYYLPLKIIPFAKINYFFNFERLIISPKTQQAIVSFSNHTDEQIFLLVKGGEGNAFAELYSRFSKKLLVYALKKVGDECIAEDLVQDIFISIWEKREKIEISDSLEKYLYSALKYKIVNFYQSKKIQRKHIKILFEFCESFTNNTQETIYFNELEQNLKRSVDKLSPSVRHVFQLSRYEYLNQDQISKKLGVSKQTVKNQISTAIKSIKNQLTSLAGFVIASFIFF